MLNLTSVSPDKQTSGGRLAVFFLLAFSFTWVYEAIVLFVLHLPINPWAIPAPFLGPSLSALILTARTSGKIGVGRLLHRLIQWRANWWWYVLVLLVLPALMPLQFLGEPAALARFHTPTLSLLPTYIIHLMIILLFGGPLAEELGWRGFALPHLQHAWGPLRGSLILGMLWSLWHLPLFLIPGYNGAVSGVVGIAFPFLEFVGSTVALTIIQTWIFNKTSGSLMFVLLLHASLNTIQGMSENVLFPGMQESLLSNLLQFLLLSLIAAIAIFSTKGRLGYINPLDFL
jgi:membrane protease YdiL (CAAX protease family)